MIRVSVTTYPYTHQSNLNKSRLFNAAYRKASQRGFTTHLSLPLEKVLVKNQHANLNEKQTKIQKFAEASFQNKEIEKEANIETLIEEGKKQLKTVSYDQEKGTFIGSPPDTIEGLLAWKALEIERVKSNLLPEKKRKIEQAAKDGNPYYQNEWEKIQKYERSLASKK